MSRKPKEGRGLSRQKNKPDEKEVKETAPDKPKHPGIIKRLAERLLSGKKLPLRFKDASIIKEIFQAVFVAHSQKLGLIYENNLVISGDGSKLPTWASPYGKKICECKGKCDCIRKLLDKEAQWGWDDYRKQWVYGYAYYELVTQDRQLRHPYGICQSPRFCSVGLHHGRSQRPWHFYEIRLL